MHLAFHRLEVLRVAGTGAFHAAVEVYRAEWSYGFTDEGTGVFCCEPMRSAAKPIPNRLKSPG